MVIGAASGPHWFLTVCAVLSLGSHAESVLLAAEDAQEPAVAESPLRGFDLLDAYQVKRNALVNFLKDHNLDSAAPSEQRSPAADEANRLIGGLNLLIDQEAERLFHEAMRSQNPEHRDSILKKLKAENYSSKVTNWINQEFKNRTVGGERSELFPTVEEAQAAEKRSEEKRAQQEAENAKKDLEELGKLKDQLLTDRLSKAANEFSEKDAQKLLAAAMRLVPPQRREQLQDLIAKYPDTKAGHEAQRVLTAMKDENERIASRKLEDALRAPAAFDQRWRRMKEIVRDHPGTKAAGEADQLFKEHAAQVPPVVITNEAGQPLEITWDVPYSRLERGTIAAGQTESFRTAFPMQVRVHIAENEWRPYQARPGVRYFLRTSPNGRPILVDEWGIEPGKPILPPQFGRPLPQAPPLPVWTEPHFFACPCLYGY